MRDGLHQLLSTPFWLNTNISQSIVLSVFIRVNLWLNGVLRLSYSGAALVGIPPYSSINLPATPPPPQCPHGSPGGGCRCGGRFRAVRRCGSARRIRRSGCSSAFFHPVRR